LENNSSRQERTLKKKVYHHVLKEFDSWKKLSAILNHYYGNNVAKMLRVQGYNIGVQELKNQSTSRQPSFDVNNYHK
jgi:hypothetical protein